MRLYLDKASEGRTKPFTTGMNNFLTMDLAKDHALQQAREAIDRDQ